MHGVEPEGVRLVLGFFTCQLRDTRRYDAVARNWLVIKFMDFRRKAGPGGNVSTLLKAVYRGIIYRRFRNADEFRNIPNGFKESLRLRLDGFQSVTVV